jgi:hypothetical protein
MKRSGRSSLEVSRLRSLERRAVERERESGGGLGKRVGAGKEVVDQNAA